MKKAAGLQWRIGKPGPVLAGTDWPSVARTVGIRELPE